MADSTVGDVSKMKVVELRKELKSRGLPHTGDKSELVTRLQAAMAQDDDHGDINLDSDEIDSDGVLEDDDDKDGDAVKDIVLDESAVELALADQPPPSPPPPPKQPESKPHKPLLKRKISEPKQTDTNKNGENKDVAPKKIVLNRAISVTASTAETDKTESTNDKPVEEKPQESNKVKITADIDAKTRLEMRAKRFGLPVKASDADRIEARKKRFNQDSTTDKSAISTDIPTGSLSENLDKLKKRAERFGESVSKIMTDIENKERIEKRKAKFGTAK